MDVSTVNTVTLNSLKVHKVPLKAHGPIGWSLSALLIGRSSATLQGIFVHPGVVDADYMGRIHAMVSTPTPPVTIPAQTRIAQLVPFKSCVPKTDYRLQGNQGFRSTRPPEVYWSQDISDQKPQMVCTLTMQDVTPSQIRLKGLIDRGSDVIIISASAWPPSWPTMPVGSAVAGLGGTAQSYMSANPVLLKNSEGQTDTVHPYVNVAPLNLWGWNVLAAWGVKVGTNF